MADGFQRLGQRLLMSLNMMRLRIIENSRNKIDDHQGVSSLVARNHVTPSIAAP